MTRLAIFIMRERAGALAESFGTETTVYYHNGDFGGYHVLDTLLEDPGLPTTLDALVHALESRGFGPPPFDLTDATLGRLFDWLFIEIDQLVVVGVNRSGRVVAINKLDRVYGHLELMGTQG